MSVNDTTKLDYINNYFHQYLDIDLNTNVLTNSFVNLVIPIEKLFDLSKTTFKEAPEGKKYSHQISVDDSLKIKDVLSKYEDSPIKGEIDCICERVIDGDTIVAKLPIAEKTKKNELKWVTETKSIRLVGIDTPEINYKNPEESAEGAYDSKKFLEKVCYSERYYKEHVIEGLTDIKPNDKVISLNVDNEKQFDKYNRVLAVLIVDNKNINEVLLKEKLARIMYIPPSEFYPFDWDYTPEEKKAEYDKKKESGDIPTEYQNDSIDSEGNIINNENTSEETTNSEETNNSEETTPKPTSSEEIMGENAYDDLLKMSLYFNSDMSNIVFTPQNDSTKLYRYEVYKGVMYIRMEPFSDKIRMHILPKGYDCTNQLLFFKDNMVEKRKPVLQDDSRSYKVYDIDDINAYFQEGGEDRDRTSAQSAQPPYDETGVERTFCEFDYDISKEAKSYENIQICSGYNYNHTSPYYAIHYTGVKDEEENRAPEDRCTLIDGNMDEVKDKTNIITHMVYDDNNSPEWNDDIISFPPYNDIPVLCKFGSTEKYHTNDENLYITHHKIIKYFNHDMYTEEDINYTTSENNNHCYAEWKENFE